MNDYERVTRILRYLETHRVERPDLATLANAAGLGGSHHLHRFFAAWAGVTPQHVLQSLTLAHTKRLLRTGASVLDVALAAGCSGPGRQHDLCVTLETAAPGEVKSGGRGWQIGFGFAATPFGECIVGEGPRGLCHLAFVDDRTRSEAQAALRQDWSEATVVRDDRFAAQLATRVFRRPSADDAPLRLRAFVRGSAFQVRVWQALLRVPSGALTTYGQLAIAVGQPGAARAVGAAVGSNPLAWLIPCHRVIRATGVLGEYRWGRVRKRALIAWETAPLL